MFTDSKTENSWTKSLINSEFNNSLQASLSIINSASKSKYILGKQLSCLLVLTGKVLQM